MLHWAAANTTANPQYGRQLARPATELFATARRTAGNAHDGSREYGDGRSAEAAGCPSQTGGVGC